MYTATFDLDFIYCRAGHVLSYLFTFAYGYCRRKIGRMRWTSDENGLLTFSPGRLAFKEEGAGKVRVFAIPNALKQALLRPAHDWCMKI